MKLAMPTKAPAKPTRVNKAALMELSLRNHLCLFVLGTEHGTAIHLGTIVRTMFDSFFLFDKGFGTGEASIYTDVDRHLGELAMSASADRTWRLSSDAVSAIARLLALFDSQLQIAPVDDIVAAHRRSEANFQAASEQRLSIAALVQRSSRNGKRFPFRETAALAVG
jgi:hypothetical protein